MAVTEDKYLNRLRAFIRQSVKSRRQADHLASVLDLLAEMLAKTDNLASRSIHSGEVLRFEAERILIYTYLAIGDILVLAGLGTRPEAVGERQNLNKSSFDDLHKKLGLPKDVAAEIVKARKYRKLESWDDVAEVKGVGPKIVEKLKDLASL